MKILLVEDEEFNLMVLEEMIKIFYPDIEIVTALNGKLGFEKVSQESFDLILSDVNMPVMDGYELIQKIRSELGVQTPVIAATAFAIQGDKEKLLLAGFDNYVSKPIDINELEQVLKQYL